MNENIAVPCPYCGEIIYIEPEPLNTAIQYVEDCHVCCQPIVFSIQFFPEGSKVSARREND